jgi:hypothetical protein
MTIFLNDGGFEMNVKEDDQNKDKFYLLVKKAIAL